MKKVYHHVYKNTFMVYEWDVVIEYDNNGHVKRAYRINEITKRKRAY